MSSSDRDAEVLRLLQVRDRAVGRERRATLVLGGSAIPVADAGPQLQELIERAVAGEEILITLGPGRPTVRLDPRPTDPPIPRWNRPGSS